MPRFPHRVALVASLTALVLAGCTVATSALVPLAIVGVGLALGLLIAQLLAPAA